MDTDNPAVLVHVVDPCPRCQKRHEFPLEVRQGIPVFGGGPQEVEVALICPKTGLAFTTRVLKPQSGEIVPPASVPAGSPLPHQPGSTTGVDLGFAEWVKGSRAIALEYCKTMLTASSGAVGVYFAVLKYLGIDAIDGTLQRRAAGVPPLLFLAAVLAFAAALRPTYQVVTEVTFPAFRAERLARLDRFALAGTVLFVAAVALAIVLFLWTLEAR